MLLILERKKKQDSKISRTMADVVILRKKQGSRIMKHVVILGKKACFISRSKCKGES